MRRSDITYGQLDQYLRSLGFTCRLWNGEPPTRVYEHQETGALITTPPYRMTARAYVDHVVAARITLNSFGIASPEIFDADLRKAG